MTKTSLPPRLTPKGGTPTFTADSIPEAIRQKHSLGVGQWGVFHLLEGSVWFVDLATRHEQHIKAPDTRVIQPEAPHKLRLDGPLRCRIDFFAERRTEHPTLKNREVSDSDDVCLSFKRCEAAGDFAERFYEVFMGSSPEISPFFAQTNFEKQRKLLRATVYIMVTRDVEDPNMRETMDRIGCSHSRSELNVQPALYEVWLDSLGETVRGMDPEWTLQLEAAWRRRMRPGIQVITSLY